MHPSSPMPVVFGSCSCSILRLSLASFRSLRQTPFLSRSSTSHLHILSCICQDTSQEPKKGEYLGHAVTFCLYSRSCSSRRFGPNLGCLWNSSHASSLVLEPLSRPPRVFSSSRRLVRRLLLELARNLPEWLSKSRPSSSSAALLSRHTCTPQLWKRLCVSQETLHVEADVGRTSRSDGSSSVMPPSEMDLRFKSAS